MKLFTIAERKNLLEEEIHRIVEIIKKDYEPDRIILFGSLAEGKIHEWSDIDLLIVKKTAKRPIERCLEVCRLIKPKIGIDLFIRQKSTRYLSMKDFRFWLISLKWERYCMKRESKEWIKIAMENLQSAECLFTIPLYRMVCYHAQQTAEKILKATLTEHEAEFSRTHNILDLCNAVEKAGHKAPLIAEDAIFLNSIYRARYPSDLGLLPSGEPTKEDADKALAIAKNTMNWFKDIAREH